MLKKKEKNSNNCVKANEVLRPGAASSEEQLESNLTDKQSCHPMSMFSLV